MSVITAITDAENNHVVSVQLILCLAPVGVCTVCEGLNILKPPQHHCLS